MRGCVAHTFCCATPFVSTVVYRGAAADRRPMSKIMYSNAHTSGDALPLDSDGVDVDMPVCVPCLEPVALQVYTHARRWCTG